MSGFRLPTLNRERHASPVNYSNLNIEKALIWRILHRANLPWVLQNGIHCGNSPLRSPDRYF